MRGRQCVPQPRAPSCAPTTSATLVTGGAVDVRSQPARPVILQFEGAPARRRPDAAPGSDIRTEVHLVATVSGNQPT